MSAWAKVQAEPALKLSEIMDDQEFMLSDQSLAEVISYSEIQHGSLEPPCPTEVSEPFGTNEEDADLAFAIALQEQLDEEERFRQQNRESSGNVRVDLGTHEHSNEMISPKAQEDIDEFDGRANAVIDKAIRLQTQKKRVKGVDLSGGRVSAKDLKSTQQGVLDPATKTLVFKMLQNGTLLDCDTRSAIKTGKEASVFHGIPDFSTDRNAGVDSGKFECGCAVKIFKTTLNEFTNRSDYYDGDHRFGKFNKIGSTRESIAKWAEKEYRNLCRVNKRSKILAPTALTFKEHIVVMSFIGDDRIPAPQIREVPQSMLTSEQWTLAYLDTISIIYSLYHDCSLVHGDLSPYNLLFYKGDVYAIDFGQAVDRSHPEHITFLLRDIDTVTQFYLKHSVPVLDSEACLSLVVQPIAIVDKAISELRPSGGSENPVHDNGIRDKLIRRFILHSVDC